MFLSSIAMSCKEYLHLVGEILDIVIVPQDQICVLSIYFFILQIDQKIENMFSSRKRVTDVAKPIVSQAAPAPLLNLGPVNNPHKLEMAKKLAQRINYSRHIGPEVQDISQMAAIAIMKGESVVVPQVHVSSLISYT